MVYFVQGPRGSGKTTQLIMQSAASGIPIMVARGYYKKILKENAQRLGVQIPEPIIWRNDSENDDAKFKTVLVDDVEHFLNHILMTTCCAMCVGATVGEPVFKIGGYAKTMHVVGGRLYGAVDEAGNTVSVKELEAQG